MGGAHPPSLQVISRFSTRIAGQGTQPIWCPRRDSDRSGYRVQGGVPNVAGEARDYTSASFREHPQSDGLAERMVQTMKRALRKCLCDGGGQQWDELLPCSAMGYRMSKQKSVGYSPYFLMFGRYFRAGISQHLSWFLTLPTRNSGCSSTRGDKLLRGSCCW